MPRIRKKTSKRGTTNQRAKIKHKIAEGRRKKKKEAKKNPQWKSKKKKDPGIPSEFPYKDQILAEVAESRRQESAEEAKRRRKEESKLAPDDKLIGDDGDNQVETYQMEEISPSALHHEEDAPLLINHDLLCLKAVLDQSDVVLYVLDARDPTSFRLPHIEEVVSAKQNSKLVFILNKIDLVPRECLASWAKYLRSQRPTFLFRAASAFLPTKHVNDPKVKDNAKESIGDALGAQALLDYLRQCSEDIQEDTLQVAVVGLTNAGKSAIVNSLIRRPALRIYIPTPSTETWSTTTTHPCQVSIDPILGTKKITLIDTPGISLHAPASPLSTSSSFRIRDIFLRNRGRIDKLKDPVLAVNHIISRANARDLMLHYGLPAFTPGDTSAFLAGVARAGAYLKKGGVLDVVAAARGVLRDWMEARLGVYTEANLKEGGEGEEDKDVLGKLKTKKEFSMKGKGLVRLKAGELDERRVELERKFLEYEESENKEDEADEEDTEDDHEGETDEENGDDDDNEGEDADSDDAESPMSIPTSGKRKRADLVSATKNTRVVKKVAFNISKPGSALSRGRRNNR